MVFFMVLDASSKAENIDTMIGKVEPAWYWSAWVECVLAQSGTLC